PHSLKSLRSAPFPVIRRPDIYINSYFVPREKRKNNYKCFLRISAFKCFTTLGALTTLSAFFASVLWGISVFAAGVLE
ncbi:MAG: hypothetical protein E6Z15_06215, partial [Paenibacillus macerans]|nr:hypothetical protein [Paenibacillus macerans]